MSESIYAAQKVTKPKPEDVAGDFLDAGTTADMLNLTDFIRTNKIGIRWTSGNSWVLNYKGKRLGFLKIYYYGIDGEYERLFGETHPLHKSWFFCHKHDYLEHYYSMEDIDLKSFIFEHIYARNCGNCFCTWHLKGLSELNEQKAGYMKPADCGCWPLRIYNPAGEALEFTKRLIEFRMKCILEDSK